MGVVFQRGNKLYIRFKDATGKWVQRGTGLGASEKRKAQQVVEQIEARIAAGAEFDESTTGPVTVARYFERWIKERRVSKLRSAHDDDTRIRKHAIPVLGSLKIEEVRPRHVPRLRSQAQGRGRSRAENAASCLPHASHHV